MDIIRYYFWREIEIDKWQAEGCLWGYTTAEKAKIDNEFTIKKAENKGLCWVILEAKPFRGTI